MSQSQISPDTLRAEFSRRLSDSYGREVPAYATLLQLVETSNRTILTEQADPRADDAGAVSALSAQRHGAIRVGSAAELALLCRLFALYGMYPVDFYDLVPAGLPVYSTAFRPLEVDAIEASPFRIFCSLLRTELIAPDALRRSVEQSIAGRTLLGAELTQLLKAAEARGGVLAAELDAFVAGTVEVFRWTGEAAVPRERYEEFLASHRLIADIAAFKGPHINHLTPSALDIDRVHPKIAAAGLSAKATIEGPPPRRCPILLRQTAFNAVSETVRYPGSDQAGQHTARFGEVEQRGAALTPAGRARYDACLAQAAADSQSQDISHDSALAEAFAGFPDDWLDLLEQSLVYFRFSLAAGVDPAQLRGLDIDDHDVRVAAVRDGLLAATPIRYEDFLPVSAAGIFRSNLGGEQDSGWSTPSSRAAFEAALGRPVVDSQSLYLQQQQQSLQNIRSRLETLISH